MIHPAQRLRLHIAIASDTRTRRITQQEENRPMSRPSLSQPFAFALALAIATLGATCALPAYAQAWPAKPIRFIVPFAAGGVADVVTRAVTPRLS